MRFAREKKRNRRKRSRLSTRLWPPIPRSVAVVKKAVQDKIDAATAAFDAFKTESNLTNEAYQAAVTLIQTAKTEYEDRKSMLDEAAQTELDEAFAELDYTKNYYKRFNGW